MGCVQFLFDNGQDSRAAGQGLGDEMMCAGLKSRLTVFRQIIAGQDRNDGLGIHGAHPARQVQGSVTGHIDFHQDQAG